jgi:ribonucleoside-diphosphate reductase protein NrdI
LITRSVNFGEITAFTDSFLKDYVKKVIGVAVSGNRSWGKTYGAAGDKIALKYGIPLVLKFEGLGFPNDVRQVKDWLEQRKKKND